MCSLSAMTPDSWDPASSTRRKFGGRLPPKWRSALTVCLLLGLPLAGALTATLAPYAILAPVEPASSSFEPSSTPDERPNSTDRTGEQVLPAERQAVRQTALNYAEAFYQADPTLVQEVTHSRFQRHGYRWEEGQYHWDTVSHRELLQLVASWNRDHSRMRPDTVQVDIFRVHRKIANVQVTTFWGTDHLHLVKTDSGWKIQQILWQAHPRGRSGPGSRGPGRRTPRR